MSRPDDGHWVEDLAPCVKEPGTWWVIEGKAYFASSLRSGRIKRPHADKAGTPKDPWTFLTRGKDLWVKYARVR